MRYCSFLFFLHIWHVFINLGDSAVSEAFRQNRFLCSNTEEKFCSLIKTALEEGDINERNYHGKTLTYIAAENGLLEGLRILLELEANLNLTDIYGTSPLHAAVRNNHVEAIKYLGHHLIDLNLKDNDDETALYLAAKNENYECVKVLLMYGANPNAKGPNNLTAMHLSSMFNKLHKSHLIIKELVKYNGDVNAEDTTGKTPLWYAARAGNENGVMELLMNGAVIYQDVMWETVDRGKFKILKMLVKNKGNIHSKGGWSNSTLLVAAVTHDYFDIARFLLDAGVQINEKFGQGFTALHRAVGTGSIKCIRLLLDRKCNVNVRDDNGRTPLDYCQSIDICDLLLERGAKTGYTVRDIVVSDI